MKLVQKLLLNFFNKKKVTNVLKTPVNWIYKKKGTVKGIDIANELLTQLGL